MRASKILTGTLLLCTVFGLTACDDEKEPIPEPQPVIVIGGWSHRINNAQYYSGPYPYFEDLECTNFYIELNAGGGITVEIDESLVGETVYFEKGDTFWFFGIGNGNGIFVPLQHDEAQSLYKGWFKVDRDLGTNRCSLQFEIDTASKKGWATGNIEATFKRKLTL